MEKQKSSQSPLQKYQAWLNSIIIAPTLQSLSQFVQKNQKDFELASAECGKLPLQRMDKDVIMAKKKIIEELHQCFILLKENEIRIFKAKIKMLTFSTTFIIKEGIINLYSDLSEIKKKCLLQPIVNTDFHQLLERTQKVLQPLIKYHFVTKQLQKMDGGFQTDSLKLILSQKKIQSSQQSATSINSIHSIKQLLSDKAMKQIQKNIQKKSIKQLITEQLKGEQDEINEGVETCRICKYQFKFKNLQNHVKYCSSIEAHKAKRCQIMQKQTKLIQQMKIQISRDNVLFQGKQVELCFQINRIYRNIIATFDKSQILKRRGSLNENNRHLKRVSFQIDQYLLENSKSELLANFKALMKQRILIQKKLVSLQHNYIKSSKQNFKSQYSVSSDANISSSHSIRSLKINKMSSVKTKKSIFAKKSASGASSSDKQLQQLSKFHSIKVNLEDQGNNSDDQEQIHYESHIRMHRSLSNFNYHQQSRFKQICIDDFDIIKFLGKGAFGKVYMIRRKKTKDIYALKMIKIQQNWDQKQLDSIKNQHQILSKIAGQHLVKAPFSFSQGSAHFFVLEYMPGGDLSKIIQQQIYLDYSQSKHYLAQIILAIEHLHEFGIIHRDLKPENLIFDENGHLKLTDFGLSQMRINDKIRKAKRMNSSNNFLKNTQKMSSSFHDEIQQNFKKSKLKSALAEGRSKNRLIGTPDYIAPQIIKAQSLDNLSIDWWSLGVIAYEMMVGCRPFCANSIDEIIDNILSFNITWPEIGEEDDMILPQAADLIKKLLNPDYKQRLGAHGVVQIKEHPFFEGINWQSIKTQKPPIMPLIDRKQNYETSYQSSQLKLQIKTAIGSPQVKSSFKLQNFVRYDILVQQTLQSADKQIGKRQARIKKLKSIQQNLQNQSLQNSDLPNSSQYKGNNVGSLGVQAAKSQQFICNIGQENNDDESSISNYQQKLL